MDIFTERARINKDADEKLADILSKRRDNFEQYEAVSQIEDIEVAKVIIKRLLDKISE